MARGHYEERLEHDLESVRKRIRRMGGAVVSAIRDAVESVLVCDTELATETILGDLPINRQAREIDHRCHVFIARHLPSAGHLRFISSAMRLSKTLERIGDYAETMARAAAHFNVPPPDSIKRDIEMMGHHAANILEQSLAAYDASSVVEARATRAVVGQYGTTFDKVFADLVAAGNERLHPIEELFGLAAICNRLERIIHQAKNICEQTIFAVTGERKQEKTFDFLFVDSRGAGASLLAARYCRHAYPDAGTYHSAGWDAVSEPDDAFVKFAESKGLDIRDAVPSSFDDIIGQVADYDLIVDLVGGVRDHIRKVPFHTTVINWPLDDRADPAAVAEQLFPRLSDLMQTLRGEDED